MFFKLVAKWKRPIFNLEENLKTVSTKISSKFQEAWKYCLCPSLRFQGRKQQASHNKAKISEDVLWDKFWKKLKAWRSEYVVPDAFQYPEHLIFTV